MTTNATLAPLFAELPAESVAELERMAAYVLERQTRLYHTIVELGLVMQAAKERYPRQFGAWLTHMGVSADSAENYMNVAKRLPNIPHGVDAQFTAKGLYVLGRGSVDDATRAAALAAAEQGVVMDFDEATIRTNAPAPIRERYAAAELTKKQAVGLTRALANKGTPPSVAAYALQTNVSDPAVVPFLAKWYTEEKRGGAKFWSRLTEDDNTLNGIKWACPIATATALDCQRFEVDTAAMRRQEEIEAKYKWLRGDFRVIERGGEIVLAPLEGQEKALKAHVGETLRVDVRLKV